MNEPQKQPSVPKMQAEASVDDGVYRYRWTSRFGRHTVYFEVNGGVIQDSIARSNSPVKQFIGKTIDELAMARLADDWRFKDDSMHQMTSDAQCRATKPNGT